MACRWLLHPLIASHGGIQNMAQSFLAIIAVAILIVMSFRANSHFSDQARLPMQWGIDGSVNWTTPRRVALSFTPALAAIVLAATTIATLLFAPRPGQEGMEIPVVVMLGLGFIAAHAFHLWLIEKTTNRGGR